MANESDFVLSGSLSGKRKKLFKLCKIIHYNHSNNQSNVIISANAHHLHQFDHFLY
jgi:hypothetical protein